MFRNAIRRLREMRQLLAEINAELRDAIQLYTELIELGRDSDQEDADRINDITGKVMRESITMQDALDETNQPPKE